MNTNDEKSLETATANLLDSFTTQRPRRSLLKGAMAGLGAGAALGATSLFEGTAAFAHANTSSKGSKKPTAQQIFDIGVTAERLAVTTYTNAIQNAGALGLTSTEVDYLSAALVEEQIHELFFESLGGKAITSTFSYPNGAATFTNLSTFISAQQTLEGAFDSAFLVLVYQLGEMGQYRLAQIMAQIACIEAEHRALGRAIGGLDPADNWAYTPVLLKTILDAPTVIADAGYLSPAVGNSYQYQQVSINNAGVTNRVPYVAQ
jgi:hypothetical protein